MKNFIKSFVVCTLLAWFGISTTSCTPDVTLGPPLFEVGEPDVESALSVKIPINAENLRGIYYILQEVVEGEENIAPINQQIRLKGVSISPRTKSLDLTGNDGLLRGRNYAIYIIATISEREYYNNGEVFVKEFTTPESYPEGTDVTVVATTYEGGKIDVIFPQSLRDKNHRIKWGVTNVAHYNLMKLRGKDDIIMMYSNDGRYPGYLISGDTLIDICHYNAYRRNARGEIGYYDNTSGAEVPPTDPGVDAGTAEPIQYYYLGAPNEPMVVFMSEVGYADCTLGNNEEGENADHKVATCDKKHPTINWQWGTGWYWFPFDYEGYRRSIGNYDPGVQNTTLANAKSATSSFDNYWHEGAWHKKIEFTTLAPGSFDGSVTIEATKLTPDSGVITVTPSKEVFAITYAIYPSENELGESYMTLVRDYLGGDTNLLQWFSTSEFGMYAGFRQHYASDGPLEIILEDDYFIYSGLRYHVLVTAVASKTIDGEQVPDLTRQSFHHEIFAIPYYTKDAPVIEVSAYDAYSVDEVKFNIKNPNWKENPVSDVSYAANYTREFNILLGSGTTYKDIVSANKGYADLDDASIAAINSDSGFDMIMPGIRPDQSFTLAVMGWNDESRPSDPDLNGGIGAATATTLPVEADELLDLTKLNELKGDWTATATIKTYDFENGAASEGTTRKWKVTIGDLTSPETVTQEVYDIFAKHGVSKEDTDSYFATFKEQESSYNTSLRNQNRVLCQGWTISDDRAVSTASPWDLFTMDDYSADTEYLFYDFGPKWFLQVNKDGDVFIPVNYNIVPPLTRWYNASNHYLVPADFISGYTLFIGSEDETSVEEVSIPIEISEDKNTLTLKGRTVTVKETSYTLYPNVIFDYNGRIAMYNPYIVSEVVLTRGWNESEQDSGATAALSSLQYTSQAVKSAIYGTKYKTPAKSYGMTPLLGGQKSKKATQVTHKSVTREQIFANYDKAMANKRTARK